MGQEGEFVTHEIRKFYNKTPKRKLIQEEGKPGEGGFMRAQGDSLQVVVISSF